MYELVLAYLVSCWNLIPVMTLIGDFVSPSESFQLDYLISDVQFVIGYVLRNHTSLEGDLPIDKIFIVYRRCLRREFNHDGMAMIQHVSV